MKTFFQTFAFILVAYLALGIGSCKKDSESQAEIDEKKIVDYLAANELDAIRLSSGLYYKIQNVGNGMYPSLNSYVTVRYKGWLLDGTVFDQTSGGGTFSSYLYGVIEGWQVGVRLIRPGGKITLYIPSGMAYGKKATTSIPANSVLVFDIELVSFY